MRASRPNRRAERPLQVTRSRVIFGAIMIIWAVSIFGCSYLAVVNGEDKTRAAFVGLAGTLGAGFAAAIVAVANAWRTDILQDAREATQRKRQRYAAVLELSRKYDAHRRRAHQHRTDADQTDIDSASRTTLKALAWQERDAAAVIRDDLMVALELAGQEAEDTLAAIFVWTDTQLDSHDHWLPSDPVDELPLADLRSGVEGELQHR
jgi:Kef-type K+ transport system membrane component KefB